MMFFLLDKEVAGQHNIINPLFKSIKEELYKNLGKSNLTQVLLQQTCVLPYLHTQCRSVLGQVNWLQSRTQYKACYRFSRCVSAAASPTTADVKSLNKLVRSIRSEPCVLKYWHFKGKLRLIGYLDAAYRNNTDNSSQRGQTFFLSEERTVSRDSVGSMVDFESHKNKPCGPLHHCLWTLLIHQVLLDLSDSSWFVDWHQCRARGYSYADWC